MLTYVTLSQYTEQGIKNIQDAPERIAKLKEKMAAAGAEFVAVYLTHGRYDLMTITRWPDEITATKFLIAQAQQGNIRTETFRAFDEGEMAKILG